MRPARSVSSGGRTVPLIEVAGTPRDCGLQYGAVARDLIASNLNTYLNAFHAELGLTPDEIYAHATRYVPLIDAYDPDTLAEMRGLADGAEVPFEAVVALNARTELLNTLRAPHADDGCTSFAVLPAASVRRHTLIGQNWDWKPAVGPATILVRSRRGDDPAVLTLTEAGLLAKIGFNEAGIGLVTNFLLSDRRRFGMPIHVTRRKVLATRSLEAAIAAITDVERAQSANYLLGSADGRAVNVEAWPEARALLEPEDGVLAHANHFRRLTDDRQDLGRDIYPDSAWRDGRLRHLLSERAGSIEPAFCQACLADHAEHPHSICRHVSENDPAAVQIETLGSVVIDLDERIMDFCAGPPCSSEFVSVALDGG